MIKNKKIFIACDASNIRKIKKIIKHSKTNKLKIGYKFGLQFFYSKKGRYFLSKIKNKIVFLDIKLNDIPNTCSEALNSLKDLKNINYITAHVNGGYEMLRAIKKSAKKINNNIKVLGVTVLTSISSRSLKKIGHTKSLNSIVAQQAKLAKAAGLDGIVCSGLEVKTIRKICKKMEIVVPGIRMTKYKTQDQKRVVNPKEAFRNGADSVVIGRSITKGNIKKNIQKLIKSLE